VAELQLLKAIPEGALHINLLFWEDSMLYSLRIVLRNSRRSDKARKIKKMRIWFFLGLA